LVPSFCSSETICHRAYNYRLHPRIQRCKTKAQWEHIWYLTSYEYHKLQTQVQCKIELLHREGSAGHFTIYDTGEYKAVPFSFNSQSIQ
jgi:hypothetical protein